MFHKSFQSIDDLVTISGSRKNLECVLRIIESLTDTRPNNVLEEDVKMALRVMNQICRK